MYFNGRKFKKIVMIFKTFGKIKSCNSEFQFKFYSHDTGMKY